MVKVRTEEETLLSSSEDSDGREVGGRSPSLDRSGVVVRCPVGTLKCTPFIYQEGVLNDVVSTSKQNKKMISLCLGFQLFQDQYQKDKVL